MNALIVYEDASVSHYKAELRKIKLLKDNLVEKLEYTSNLYRKFCPKEISEALDMEVRLCEAEAELKDLLRNKEELQDKDIKVEKKERRKSKAKLKDTYRRIVFLCHPDRALKKTKDKDVLKTLHELFLTATVEYDQGNGGMLALIYDDVLEIYASLKDTPSDNPEKPKETYTSNVDTDITRKLILRLKASIAAVVGELRQLHSSPLYLVLEMDNRAEFEDAKRTYKYLVMKNTTNIFNQLNKVREHIKKASAQEN